MIYGEELGAGGISTKTIPPQGLNLTLKGGNGKIDCTFTGITSQWLYLGQHYRLIAKPGSAPTSPMDGVQVKDVQVGAIGDAVISASITGLTNGVQYYVRLYVRGENGWQTSVDAVGTATPVAGIALSTIAASDETTEQIIMLPEQGVPVKFLLLKHNYENSGRSLVLRKDCYNNVQWANNTTTRGYGTCYLDSWMNESYFNLLDTSIRGQIVGINIPSVVNNGSGISILGSINRNVFALSNSEYGGSNEYTLVEGALLPYFASDIRRIAYLSGTTTEYWTRTQMLFTNNTEFSGNTFRVKTNGSISTQTNRNELSTRPAFTLPADLLLDPEPNPDGSYSPLAA